MTRGLCGVRSAKISGRGVPFTFGIVHPSDILSGYMSPKLHWELRRTERFRKQRML
ncbi:MAG: hypothetical protein WC484_07955 [Candidatus Omnitrophota bacterium]